MCLCAACGAVWSGFGGVSVCVCVCECVRVCLCAACGAVWTGFGGVSVQQVALWCVCGVGIVWLRVEGIKCLLFQETSFVS